MHQYVEKNKAMTMSSLLKIVNLRLSIVLIIIFSLVLFILQLKCAPKALRKPNRGLQQATTAPQSVAAGYHIFLNFCKVYGLFLSVCKLHR